MIHTSIGKRKEIHDLNEPPPKISRLEEQAQDSIIVNQTLSPLSMAVTGAKAETLPVNVTDWSSEHFQEICSTFKIHSVREKTDLDIVLSEFSSVIVDEHHLEYVYELQHSFEELQCPVTHSSTAETGGKNEILPQSVQKEIVKRLRTAKVKLSSNPYTRFSDAVSFLNDLRILSQVTMANVGPAHIKMLFHSLLKSTGLHVRSGCDYTSHEEIFDLTFNATPDMRIYAENHTQFREPRIIAVVKVDPVVSMETEPHPSRDVIAQAVGELLLDFKHAQHPHAFLALVVQATKVWLLCLRRCTGDLAEGEKCRILVDLDYRWKSFIKCKKELLISEPLDYLCREHRAKLYEAFAKFASVAGLTSNSIPCVSAARQKLFTK